MVGGCLASSWLAWQARGVDSWVVEALRVGYRIPFNRPPPLSECPISLPAYSPHSIRGVALNQELQNLLRKGAVEPAPQSPGFYSRLFLVKKASGSWRPIIDLSTLNHYVTSSRFHMETPRSVLNSIRPGDWMISLDLQDTYLQVPVHYDSRRFLRFVVDGKPFQFRVLCFGLTTAPQVFTRIMAPVSAILHRHGVRMLRYLDDWLILASSKIACLQSRDRLLSVCTELGIQVNLTKSSLVPSQSIVYLGMEIHSLPFIARPTPARASNLIRLIEEFLSTPSPPACLWRRLLGHLSSLILLVSGGMIRMRLLQLCFKDQWDFLDDQFQVSWSPLCREDLLWWSRKVQLREGVSLSLPAPDISFFSDASGVGWGALVGEHHASGLWLPHQKALSINMRELLAVQLGLQAFEHLIVGMSVALFCDNTTTVAYLRRSGGTFSSTMNSTAREVLLADLLGRRGQVVGTEWSLHPASRLGQSVDRHLCDVPQRETAPVLLARPGSPGRLRGCVSSSLGRPGPVRVPSLSSDRSGGRPCLRVIAPSDDSGRTPLAREGVVRRPVASTDPTTSRPALVGQSASAASLQSLPPRRPRAEPSRVATLKRYFRKLGFSGRAAGVLSGCLRSSTSRLY